mmetsp:Transcript_18887/g.23200  ORF Transcript_18887/g.23200 Transcript_18887/m.23200 type:complete len:80 (-) Transcript_18887:1658-1897(-)
MLFSSDERELWIGDIIRSRSFVRRLISRPLSVPSKNAISCERILLNKEFLSENFSRLETNVKMAEYIVLTAPCRIITTT